MRAKVAMQSLAHTAVAVDYVSQWADYLVTHRTAEATASCQAIFISHLESLEAPSKILVGKSAALRTYTFWLNTGGGFGSQADILQQFIRPAAMQCEAAAERWLAKPCQLRHPANERLGELQTRNE